MMTKVTTTSSIPWMFFGVGKLGEAFAMQYIEVHEIGVYPSV